MNVRHLETPLRLEHWKTHDVVHDVVDIFSNPNELNEDTLQTLCYLFGLQPKQH